MWQKFKTKCKAFFTNRAAIVVMVIILVTLSVILAVTFAMNRAKKTDKPAPTPDSTTQPADTKANADGSEQGEIPIYNDKPGTEDDLKDKPSDPAYLLPVSGTLSKEHDAGVQVWSATMGDYRVHLGIDIASEKDAPVLATAAGVVSKIWNDPLMGVCVALEHENNVCSIYKNLGANLSAGISEGKSVKAGQQIGVVGETANVELAEEPHLHFEMTANGLSVDPLDYFSKDAVQTLSTDTAYEDNTVKEPVSTDKKGK